jgi:hypothetical protein
MAPQDLREKREEQGLIWFIWLVSFNQKPV